MVTDFESYQYISGDPRHANNGKQPFPSVRAPSPYYQQNMLPEQNGMQYQETVNCMQSSSSNSPNSFAKLSYPSKISPNSRPSNDRISFGEVNFPQADPLSLPVEIGTNSASSSPNTAAHPRRRQRTTASQNVNNSYSNYTKPSSMYLQQVSPVPVPPAQHSFPNILPSRYSTSRNVMFNSHSLPNSQLNGEKQLIKHFTDMEDANPPVVSWDYSLNQLQFLQYKRNPEMVHKNAGSVPDIPHCRSAQEVLSLVKQKKPPRRLIRPKQQTEMDGQVMEIESDSLKDWEIKSTLVVVLFVN